MCNNGGEGYDGSDVVFKNIQWREVALYLKYHTGTNLLDREGMMDMCPRRICAQGGSVTGGPQYF